MENIKITISTSVNVPVHKAWEIFNGPEHIIKWNSASDDWHTTKSENDLKPGGRFSARMEAKDGSMGFDFGGIYDEVETHKRITYSMDDGRKVEVVFEAEGDGTTVTETFDAENTNPVEMQRGGWQSILDNFKKYAENY